jgi:hypothetical protein
LQFFIRKGFSFADTTFHPIWYAYRCEAFESFGALLDDPNIDLTILEEKNHKTLLYYFAKEGQLSLAKKFCSAFKARHPEQYLAFLGQEVQSSAGCKKTSFEISLEKKHFEVFNFLVEERRLHSNRKSLCDRTINFPEHELHIPENEAELLLTFGPLAQKEQQILTAAQAVGGIIMTIVFAPLFFVPAGFMISYSVKHGKTYKFEFLALDDARFQVFKLLTNQKIDEANAEFIRNKKFLTALMKTCAFMRDFIECLENCQNDMDHGKDMDKCNNYINFFIDRGTIPIELTKYLIKRTEQTNWDFTYSD